MKIQDVFAAYRKDLRLVEQCINAQVISEIKLIPEIAHHLIDSGGKRFRPLLLLICARLCGYQGTNRIPMATVMEFLHTATLLHDDVIDQASMRRGKASANQVFGNSVSILVGDFLSFKAFTLMTQIGRMEILKLISEMGKIMSEGEVFQLTKRGDVHLRLEDYLDIIERKTAVLISASCAAGAILANGPQNQINALARFGTHLGMAFQITDDILDYTASSQRFGKSLGKDLEEGKITLPLLFTLQNCTDDEKQKIRGILTGKKVSPKHIRKMIRVIHRYGAIDASLATAATYVKKAKSQLKIFPDGPEKEHLHNVADYVMTRKE